MGKMVSHVPGLYSLEFKLAEESRVELSNRWLDVGVWELRRQPCLCFPEHPAVNCRAGRRREGFLRTGGGGRC